MDDESSREPRERLIEEAMLEGAHRLRRLGSDFVGGAAVLATVLDAGDLRAGYAAAVHISNWARQLSVESQRLRDSILNRARKDAEKFLEETNS